MTEEKTPEKGNKTHEIQTVKPDSSCEEKPRRKKSFGEWVFNAGTYGSAGIATLIASAIPTYWVRYGNGAKSMKPIMKTLTEVGLSPAAAKDVVITTALGSGGFATLPIVKTLENQKIPIVTAINNQVGCDTDHTAIQAEPKQTWESIFKARAVAWTLVYSSFRGAAMLIGDKAFDRFEQDFAKNIVCKPLGKATHINGQETKLFKYGRIAALDVFATVAATVLLYVGSRIFAKKGHETEQQPCVEAPKTEAVIPASTAANLEKTDKPKPFAERINSQDQELGLAR